MDLAIAGLSISFLTLARRFLSSVAFLSLTMASFTVVFTLHRHGLAGLSQLHKSFHGVF